MASTQPARKHQIVYIEYNPEAPRLPGFRDLSQFFLIHKEIDDHNQRLPDVISNLDENESIEIHHTRFHAVV